MGGLLDFLRDQQSRDAMAANARNALQSASNTVAENVTGPLDLIAAALKYAGVNVGDAPVGGSEWAKRLGLIGEVKPGASATAGETAGMVAPLAAIAKAPEIARALLKAGERLPATSVGRAMPANQAGAITWHGSPHKFDRFDASKIGTGEGAQAYGHGIYLAESPGVAQSYRASVTAQKGGAFGLEDGPTKGIATLIAARGDEGERMARQAYRELGPQLEPTIARAKAAIDANSNLYKVDLPDDAIARMLDWDKPLVQQPAAVREAFSTAMKDAGVQSYKTDGMSVYLGVGAEDGLRGANAYKILTQHARDGAIASGRDSATTLSAAQTEASDYLRALGLPGIRYLDGGSRGAGAGSSNFVIFPQEEGILKILERNGVPIK